MRRATFLGLAIGSLVLATAVGRASAAPAYHARGSQGVFWFLHITDSHVGTEWYPNADDHFKFALEQGVSVIKPWFVVATGDLCDGSVAGIPTTGQDQKEWDLYREIVDGAGMTADFFFDLPGNHDGYGDVGMGFYLANSLQGSTNQSLYVPWVVETPVGNYYFFGLNSVGDGSWPGFEDPEFTADEIAELEAGLAANTSAQLVFLAAHHPLTTPTNSEQVQALLESAGGGYYLHGHNHQIDQYLDGNGTIVVNELDTLGKGDKQNLGVTVVDHNGVTFRPTSTSEPWPHVVVTAPIDRKLLGGQVNPFAYTVCKDRIDNPVRALVFTPDLVTDVVAQVGSAQPVKMAQAGQPAALWSAEIDTTGLAAGPQEVTVTATVGGRVAFHRIVADFVDGPCDPLPEDPAPDAGAPDAGGDAGAAGSGGGVPLPDAGPPGSGGSGGAGIGGSGGDDPTEPASAADDVTEAGGCGCRTKGTKGQAPWALMGLLAVALRLARKRQR